MARFVFVQGDSSMKIEASSSLHPIEVETSEVSGFLDADVDEDGGLLPGEKTTGRLEVPVAGLESGNDLLDREADRRLNARRYPSIVAELQALERAGGSGRYRARGTVTAHGVTQDAAGELSIETEDGGAALRIRGEQAFDVRDFGIKPPKLLVFKVHPEVAVSIDVRARRDEGA